MLQYSRRRNRLFGLLLVVAMLGCGSSGTPEAKRQAKNSSKTRKGSQKRRPNLKKKQSSPKKKAPKKQSKQPKTKAPSTLNRVDGGVGPTLDKNKAAQYGIRKIEAQYLQLYTDLPPDPEVDALPEAFSQAIIHWCHYFQFDTKRIKRWKPTAYIIKSKARFRAIGVLRPELPAFEHGFQIQNELWIYEQPSAYYRRHLLLHEGTHAFMDVFLGGTGPPWYMEGLAEFLGTHRWEQGKLRMAFHPTSREQVPRWARVRLVKDAFEQGRGMSLDQILEFGPRAHLRVEPYAWSWAAVAFFENHPKYNKPFGRLRKLVLRPDELTRQFRLSLQADWAKVTREWQLFVSQMEYGYDIGRAAVGYRPTKPLTKSAQRVHISSSRGWQSTGIKLVEGEEISIRASGRFQLAKKPKIWWSEAGGVTIRYYHGHPLGKLLAAVCDEDALEPLTSLATPQPVGLSRDMKFTKAGTLFLKINDSAAELHDNSGSVEVTIQAK